MWPSFGHTQWPSKVNTSDFMNGDRGIWRLTCRPIRQTSLYVLSTSFGPSTSHRTPATRLRAATMHCIPSKTLEEFWRGYEECLAEYDKNPPEPPKWRSRVMRP